MKLKNYCIYFQGLPKSQSYLSLINTIQERLPATTALRSAPLRGRLQFNLVSICYEQSNVGKNYEKW